jgi:hypothetical protein
MDKGRVCKCVPCLNDRQLLLADSSHSSFPYWMLVKGQRTYPGQILWILVKCTEKNGSINWNGLPVSEVSAKEQLRKKCD